MAAHQSGSSQQARPQCKLNPVNRHGFGRMDGKAKESKKNVRLKKRTFTIVSRKVGLVVRTCSDCRTRLPLPVLLQGKISPAPQKSRSNRGNPSGKSFLQHPATSKETIRAYRPGNRRQTLPDEWKSCGRTALFHRKTRDPGQQHNRCRKECQQ